MNDPLEGMHRNTMTWIPRIKLHKIAVLCPAISDYRLYSVIYSISGFNINSNAANQDIKIPISIQCSFKFILSLQRFVKLKNPVI